MTEGRKIAIAFIVSMTFLMQGTDMTLLTIAIPTMAEALDKSPLTLHLVITAYMASLAVFMPISGWFADRFGARRIFCAALCIFLLGSLASCAAPNLGVLILARVVQGFGGAVMTPVGRLLVLQVFGPGRTLDAMTYLTLPVIVGPLIGPLVGAWVVSVTSWRVLFLINVPVCLLTLIAALFLMPRLDDVEHRNRFDIGGFFIVGFSLAMFQLGVEHLAHPLFGRGATVAIFCLAVVTFFIYARMARRRDRPALDLSLFSIRAYAVGVIGGGIGRVGLNSSAFLLPLLLQIGWGMTPIASAAYTSVATLGSVMGKPLLRWGIRKRGFAATTTTLAVIGAAIMALFAVMDTQASPLILLGSVVALGAVRSMHFNSVNTLTYADVPPEKLSSSVSAAGVFQQLSMGLGISGSATVLALFAPTGQAPGISDFQLAFLTMSAIPILSIPILLTLRSGDGQTP